MASNSDTPTSFLEQLISSRNRDLSIFLPLLFGFSRTNTDFENEREEGEIARDRIILINPFTQGMIVLEGNRNITDWFREFSAKDGGVPPASKASIEAMLKVEIGEGDVEECSICLEEWEIGGGDVREMPCKHKYHWGCIEKWLGVHGSCPVCRFKMPVEEEECEKKRSGSGDGEEGREIWVTFTVNNGSRRDRDDSTTATTTTDLSNSSFTVGEESRSANTEES
ncbi:hypothetical protein GIB67_028514 [Kingdonia uniflora]|uniref:RING-type E3 ubiquitin transferase n=1 Tax=Kingdonia uniflora TaxID=39325 RepID=A0A7J7KVU8_9MAGN|nr:hypothetical protein GIB67_028514 [Kingdonia uniflora]